MLTRDREEPKETDRLVDLQRKTDAVSVLDSSIFKVRRPQVNIRKKEW